METALAPDPTIAIYARVDRSVHRLMKIHAAKLDCSMASLMEKYLREGLERDGVKLPRPQTGKRSKT